MLCDCIYSMQLHLHIFMCVFKCIVHVNDAHNLATLLATDYGHIFMMYNNGIANPPYI